MSEDWSYYHGAPRSVIHQERFGTSETPPRQYRLGGGRYASSNGTAKASDSGILLGLLLLLGLIVLSKK